MRDPVIGPFNIMRTWFELSEKKGIERDEAIAEIEEYLKKREIHRKRRR